MGLRGREREIALLDTLLGDALGGAGRAVLLRGEAGIGKTALLDHVEARAPSSTIVRVTGVPSEQHLPLAGVHTLARGLAGHLDDAPRRQTDLLCATTDDAAGPAATPHAICAATLTVLGAAASRRSVVVLVDDLQWLDPTSSTALLFAARRLDRDPVVMVFTLRDTTAGPPPALDLRSLPERRLRPLDARAARDVVLDHGSSPPTLLVQDRLLAAAAGNPLALHELAAHLTHDQWTGRRPLPDPLDTGARLSALFDQEVADLPEHARRGLLVAALADTDDAGRILNGGARLGLDVGWLDTARSAGLVTVPAGRLAFRHPLVRAAVIASASEARRRATHRALAEVTDDPGRRAWHLSWSVLRPDPDVARALEAAATVSAGRGALGEAAAALERAAALTAPPEDRATLLGRAGRHRLVAGHIGRAGELADRGLALATGAGTRSALVELRARVRQIDGDPRGAADQLLAEAEPPSTHGAGTGAAVVTHAAAILLTLGDLPAALPVARRAHALTRGGDGPGALAADLVLGFALTLEGDRTTAASLLDGVATASRGVRPAVDAYGTSLLGYGLMVLERYEDAGALLRRAVGAARAEQALGLLPVPLSVSACVRLRIGDVLGAHASASEAVALAADLGSRSQHSAALAVLAAVEAARGRAAECRVAAEQALDLDGGIGSAATLGIAHTALGTAALAERRPDLAASSLEEARRWARHAGPKDPNAIRWAPELVEAYHEVGRQDEALAELAALEDAAQRTGSAWAVAAAARCRGTTGAAADADRWFATAAAAQEPHPASVERARTLLSWGESLRRRGRRVRARENLREAVETFRRLGSTGWAERAQDELWRSGGRSAPGEVLGASLTEQELQIAVAVAGGATNRETATALLLSPKTVENHLGRIYGKVGVRSRTELAARLRVPGAADEGDSPHAPSGSGPPG